MEPTSSFSTVYRAYHGLVAATLRRHGVAQASLEDATQDVFVAAYRRREDFDGRAPAAWLKAIARHVAFNYRRQTSRAARKHDALEFGSRHTPAGGDVHADVRAIDRFVQSLSSDDRRLFVLSELEGRTSRELAAPLSTNPNTLYSRIRVLRQRLRSGVRSVVVFVVPVVKPLAPAAVVAALVVGATHVRRSADTTAPHLAPPRPSRAAADGVPAQRASRRLPPTSEVAADSVPPPSPGIPSVFLPMMPTEAFARRRAPPSAPARDVPAPSVEPDTLQEQSQRLLHADALLRDDEAAEALAVLKRHHIDFPASPLADLRAAIRIDALRRSGNPTQACSEARAFVRQYPQASTVRRVKLSCPELHDKSDTRK